MLPLTRLPDIMDAAYWKNPATFIDFYLRDVACLRDDGSRGIASVVVAQQAIAAHRHQKRGNG
ncbi:uncharacterized protein LOC143279970 isoform X2 [Babylonia areolata]|uniref:uncharacterized protein LOC143279970 isoform X2 n=1 Tax=Babylonia areolata TaxID=304850 RepID=UPI003FD40968